LPVAEFGHGIAVTCEVAIFVLVVHDNGDAAEFGVADFCLRVVVEDVVEDACAWSVVCLDS
jgi:hypothetical protein